MIVERIVELAEQRKITLAELERKLDLSNSSIRKWNTTNPGIDKVKKVAKYFGVSTDYLLGETDHKNLAKEVQKYEEFQKLSNADVASSINFLLEQLGSENYALMFDGDELDDDTRDLLKNSLENSYKMAKMISNKHKD
ncbi:helix-turn-helix domain-containing protein [Mycobacteroides abscessus]|uniref:helix-turn-helix domain-containing protein n=1 Tax=unclassified Desemzia TaxID=2685243 RepID=UPI0009A6AFDD|nr:Helix-turn-helix domain [Mycobacteroides abscessus subsp. abscessus]